MELDEYIYGKVLSFIRSRKKNKLAQHRAELKELESRLTLLACAATGQRIELFPAEREGGYKQQYFFLPASCDLFATQEQNTAYYIFRTLFLAVQQKLGLNWHPEEEDMSSAASVQKAAETSGIVLEALYLEYPFAQQLHDEFFRQLSLQAKDGQQPDTSWLYGKWMKENASPENKLKEATNSKIKVKSEDPVSTVLKSKPVEEVIVAEIDQKQQEDYVLTHNFEKVETAEEFSGIWRDFDGEDQLEEQEDAIRELSMKYVVRTDDTVHSVYQSEFMENAVAAEMTTTEAVQQCLLYDEWDYIRRSYRKDFCSLYPQKLHANASDYCKNVLSEHQAILNDLRKQLVSINNKLQQQRRQAQGSEFDLDSVTDHYVDVFSRHSPDERVYLSTRKREKDLSILLLLDISLSSDGYVEGERIIDIEKKVALLFGEVIHEFDLDFSIQSFYSKTRNYSTCQVVKGFDENWKIARHCIGSLEPCGFTRMGAALRHSGRLLEQRNASNKWLILISDGKPNDYDRYEGRYGVNDVRQALYELKQRNINTYGLAIEATAKYYLPQMFGHNHFQIVSSPVDMVRALVKLYERIRYSV